MARYPSVSKILNEWIKFRIGNVEYAMNIISGSVIPASRLDAKAGMGKAIHKVAELYFKGTLDESKLHPSLIHPLQQIKLWEAEHKIVVIDTEKDLVSEKYKFTGRRDIKGRTNGDLFICDVKSTFIEGVTTGPQTAAYEILDREWSDDEELRRRFVLMIDPNGEKKYEFREKVDPKDVTYFHAALFRYNYIEANKFTRKYGN